MGAPHAAAGGTITMPSQSSTSTMVMGCFLLDELLIAAIAIISINKQLYLVD